MIDDDLDLIPGADLSGANLSGAISTISASDTEDR
jgi:uncharacterized protein YjbI with pentapeptide repeats